MAKKISELTELTAAGGGDLVPIVSDVGSTPVTRRIAVENLLAGVAGLAAATTANGSAAAGQRVVAVFSSAPFAPGRHVEYALADGTLETNTVATVNSGTQITLGADIGTGGIADNGVVTVLPTGIANMRAGVFNARDFGAAPGASAGANTAALQAALDAASAAGGVVELPAGTYQINGTLTILTQRGVRLRGSMQSYAAPGSGRGTTLQWAGGASDDMLYVFNSQDVRVEGICFDGADTTGSRAIFVDSDNTQVSKRIHIDHCFIRRCNVGIQLGAAGSGTQYQVDSDYITNCAFSEMHGSDSACVVAESQNADLLNIENTEMAYAKYGLRLVRGGITRMCNVSAGGDAAMKFISVEGPVHSINLTNCQAESVAYWLYVASSAPTSPSPITILGCTLDKPCHIAVRQRIISIASVINADVTLAGDDCEWASLFDYWTAGNEIIKSGQNCRDYYLDGADGLRLNSDSTSLKTVLGLTTTWEPGVIANGTAAQTNIAVTGVVPGDTILLAHDKAYYTGLLLSGSVASAGFVAVTLANLSGSSKTVESGTLRITVLKQ